MLLLHHVTLRLTRIASGSRHMRSRMAHNVRLLTAGELLLIWWHLLHSHDLRLLEASILLLLHSIYAWLHLLRILAWSYLTLPHDKALWITSDGSLLHFNIIVFN